MLHYYTVDERATFLQDWSEVALFPSGRPSRVGRGFHRPRRPVHWHERRYLPARVAVNTAVVVFLHDSRYTCEITAYQHILLEDAGSSSTNGTTTTTFGKKKKMRPVQPRPRRYVSSACVVGASAHTQPAFSVIARAVLRVNAATRSQGQAVACGSMLASAERSLLAM